MDSSARQTLFNNLKDSASEQIDTIKATLAQMRIDLDKLDKAA